MTNTKQATLTAHTHARLSAYATLVGVALTAPALAPNAGAAIVYSGPININVPTTTSGIYLNVVTGTSATSPGGATGWDLNVWGSSTLFIWANNGANPSDGVIQNFTGGSSATLVDNLPFGTQIDGTYSFSPTSSIETTGATAFTLNSPTNYVGFRFLNEATGQIDYGWAQISLSATYNGQPRSVVGYAYENSGAAIFVGQTAVPEPTATVLLGAMAAGAIGVRQWRRRKTA